MTSELRKYRFQALGTACQIQVHGASDPDAIVCDVVDAVREREARWSRFRTDSWVSRLNAAAGSADTVELDALDVSLLEVCRLAVDRSGGLLDPVCGALHRAWSGSEPPDETVIAEAMARTGWRHLEWTDRQVRLTTPGAGIDFGGLGKEFLVDLAATMLLEAGVRSFLVDFGGDLVARGAPPGKNGWDVALTHPADRTTWRQIRLAAGSVCTSGDAERTRILADGTRCRHILDLRTGRPSDSPVIQASVLAGQALEAGYLATLCCLLPPEQSLALLERDGAEGVLWTHEREFLTPKAHELFVRASPAPHCISKK